MTSYRERSGEDDAQGAAIAVSTYRKASGLCEVSLELGVMRNFGSISAHAWASLTPDEARELADDLWKAAQEAKAAGARP